MEEDWMSMFMVGFFVGMMTCGLIYCVAQHNQVILTQETVDDVCKQLTNDTTAIAERTPESTLICKLPSFDSTQNIIIKSNADD